jgi:hypothetical protein
MIIRFPAQRTPKASQRELGDGEGGGDGEAGWVIGHSSKGTCPGGSVDVGAFTLPEGHFL